MTATAAPGRERWRGVSLGGWLLLEPGPASPFFEELGAPDDVDLRCEWDAMAYLTKTRGRLGAAEAITRHRQRHITKRDFERIRDAGLNAVRLPFGYWLVVGAMGREPYHGPALEFVDQALLWAEECGLQVVLDLHGCPGGESGEAPCGRRRRPDGTWKWRHWQFDKTLEILRILAERYCSRSCVTGITVCNEPSGSVPNKRLSEFYQQAVEVVRDGGMDASRVSVVLPVFQRDEDEFIEEFYAAGGAKYENICFDLHCYHCFENGFHGMTLAQHLREVEENGDWFSKYPAVVGEWSLAIAGAAWTTCGDTPERLVYSMFGAAQVAAYEKASHGSFFWNWSERDSDVEWNFQVAHREGLLAGIPRQLPRLLDQGEDPLEAILHPDPPEPRVFFGEAVYVRVFHGRYIHAEGTIMRAQWCDKGEWQELVFESANGAPSSLMVSDGAEVRIRDYTGRRLYAAADGSLRSTRAKEGRGPRSVFVVEVASASSGGCEVLKHRGAFFLRSKALASYVDADAEDDRLFLRFQEASEWQCLHVEKPSTVAALSADAETVDAAAAASAGLGAAQAEAASAVSTPPKPRRPVAATPALATGRKRKEPNDDTKTAGRRRKACSDVPAK